MWSLPDINRLNADAAKAAKRNRNKTQAQLCKGHTCEYCQEKATHALAYYDVFSDDIKGYVYLCDMHEAKGTHYENYFECSDCERLHVLNYTWELYRTVVDDEELCLNCALDRYLEDDTNWLRSTEGFDFETVKESKHLIPVKGEHWKKHLEFLGNVEFDATSGQCISGGGVDELKELVEKGIKSHGKALCILDAGYQFAVSIGVYVPKAKEWVTQRKAG